MTPEHHKEDPRDCRRLYCKKCGAVMPDIEPYASDGEFWHPDNGCVNKNKRYWWTADKRSRGHGIGRWYPKSFRRAKARGARLASKMRPR